MNPLLVVLPYCEKDADLARKLIEWICQLNRGPRSNAILLMADEAVPKETMVELNTLARERFTSCETCSVKVPKERQGWPTGPNVMFHEASKQVMECYKLPWLWLEPDAVPIRSQWLNDLQAEYDYCPKRYMGAFVESSQPNLPPVHMAGVGIYPADAHGILRQFCAGDDAFDMAMARYVVPRAGKTELIQSLWGESGLAPTFPADLSGPQPPNAVSVDIIKSGTVLFHRCKDGTLIDLLRAKRLQGVADTTTQPPAAISRPKRQKRKQDSAPLEQVTENIPSPAG